MFLMDNLENFQIREHVDDKCVKNYLGNLQLCMMKDNVFFISIYGACCNIF
jgi:hypothetical protein